MAGTEELSPKTASQRETKPYLLPTEGYTRAVDLYKKTSSSKEQKPHGTHTKEKYGGHKEEKTKEYRKSWKIRPKKKKKPDQRSVRGPH
jgi:hypothetical protein